MTKDQLLRETAGRANVTLAQAEKVVKASLSSIADALERGETVKVKPFGTFYLKESSRRKGRNPKTGEEVVIPPKLRVRFKPGRLLKRLEREAE